VTAAPKNPSPTPHPPPPTQIVIALFVGPQDREHNVFLNFFWDWWWPGVFLVYPFLGRIWCAVCPFMICE
jgi:polyferredoxin